MKVVGFTIVRNALKYEYPIVESIKSILPICDEFVVNIGISDDDTVSLIKNIANPKIKIIESTWDDSIRKGGLLLANETNKAIDAINSPYADWLFYIQADEVVHENDLSLINESMKKWKDDKKVEGLLFNYLHFYGSYNYVEDSQLWYRNEVRIIRNNRHIRSFRDAQGFRKFKTVNPSPEELLKGGVKLNVKNSNARIFHYGWVKHPAIQQKKREGLYRLWHSEPGRERNLEEAIEFDYTQVAALKKFTDTHPTVMKERILKQNWNFDFNTENKNLNPRERIVHFIEKHTGWRPGEYKNYKLI
jgi:hypothetical protein